MLPFTPGHEFHADAVIVDGQETVRATMHRVWRNFLNILRHHPDIGRVIAALVTEAVKLMPVFEPYKWDDAFLESNVGTAPTTAPAATTAATASPAHVRAAAARSSTAVEFRTAAAAGSAATFEVTGTSIA